MYKSVSTRSARAACEYLCMEMELLSSRVMATGLNAEPEIIYFINCRKKLTKCRISIVVFKVKCMWDR